MKLTESKREVEIILVFMILFIALFIIVVSAKAETYVADEIVDAIYLVEGGEKAIKPFGILSIPCNDFYSCRKICYNTVVNNFDRWQLSGSEGDFLEFLGNRYAPPQLSRLNKNWVPNLRAILMKGERDGRFHVEQ
jgi:hypothetical protein